MRSGLPLPHGLVCVPQLKIKQMGIPSPDVLATIATQTRPGKDHAGLLAALILRAGLTGIKLMCVRDGITSPGRVFDADNNVIAENRTKWFHSEFGAANGNAKAVWERYKDAGLLVSEQQMELLYLSQPYGEKVGEFYQIEIYAVQEVIVRDLFQKQCCSYPIDLYDLEDGCCEGYRLDAPIPIGDPFYKFSAVRDIAAFVDEKNALFKADKQRDSRRIVTMTNTRTGESRTGPVVELFPAAYNPSIECHEKRLLDDWATSSAGQSGAKIYEHWYFNTWDYVRGGERHLGAIPGWTTTKKLATIEAKPRNITDYAIFDKLTRLDERVGVPFGWYFFMLHGNRVHDWAGKRILKAVESGLLVLPDHDYLVLRRWYDEPYGF